MREKSGYTAMRIAKKCSYLVFSLPVVLSSIFAAMAYILWQPTANAATAADPSTIPACNGNSECFAFTVDTRLTSSGATTNTTTSFSIPTSGNVGSANNPYKWLIDWGDGSDQQAVSGTSGSTSAGIAHNYASTGGAGQYQITIQPNGTATAGWLNAFSFKDNTAGANTNANKYMFRSIDTPFTELMRTKGAAYRFSQIFYGTVNGTVIPSNLFTNVSTTGDTNLSYLFSSTFYNFASNSTTAAIPAGLFSSIDTSSGTNFDHVFHGTFYAYATNSTTGTIPTGLFSTIDTSRGTNFNYAFFSTFSNYAKKSTTATIPAGLFSTINTSSSSGAALSYMFGGTFNGYAYNSTAGTIPAGLFSSISTTNCTNFSYMFSNTFNSYTFNSTTATIPAGLFSTIDTSRGTNLAYMFYSTFSSYAFNSTTGTIPAGLFNSIVTNSNTNFSNLFEGTFNGYARNSTTGTIPTGLFDSIKTSLGTDFSYMLCNTFSNYAYNSITGTIPAGLFNGINTARGTNFNSMYYNVFNNYASRKATFKVGGTVAGSWTYISPYWSKIGPNGTPDANPTVNATTGSQVIPTYNTNNRNINAPTGTYANAIWYRTDGTSCAVTTPTPDCGAQTPAQYVSFPNNTEWATTTSTEHGSVTFYSGPASAAITNTTIIGWANIELVPQTATITLGGIKTTSLLAGANITSWFTNLPAGLTATVANTAVGAAAIDVTFTGTPVADSTGTLVVAIPASTLSSNALLNVATNPNATWRITTPLATMSPATISGWTGTPLASGQTVNIGFTNTAIANGTAFRLRLAAGTDVTNWFTNIPSGLTATIDTTANIGDTAVSVVFAGTPAVNNLEAIAVTIPGAQLTSGADLEVASNPETQWQIVTAAADIANVMVSGTVNQMLKPQSTTVNLTDTTIKDSIPAETNITSWFTNLPAGLKVTTSSSVAAGSTTIPITFSGQPTVASSATIDFTIPAAYLISDANLAVIINHAAHYQITIGVPNTGVAKATLAGSLLAIISGMALTLVIAVFILKKRRV
ncbi:hypothetical protein FWF48_02140 [Candidatus Saccharibacteria bacterium]|nr:hypothetical protein [Candidatus Saccharibacteria bacterium]